MRRWMSTAAIAGLVLQGLGLSVLTAPSASADWRDLSTFTADALPTWQTNGIAWTVETAGGVVYVGGTFTKVRPPGAAAGTNEVTRDNLAAFDAATGELLPCAPSILLGTSGGTIRALKASPDGSRLYVGGSFSRVDGVGVANLVSIDTATCQLSSTSSFRRPAVAATVRAIDATSNAVYFGGDFTSVDGQSRPRYAAVTTAGALTAATVNLNAPVRAIVAAEDHGKVVIGGNFTSVNGSTAINKLVGVDPATGAVVQTYPGWIPTNSVPKVLIRDSSSFYLGAEGTGGGVFDGRLKGSLDGATLAWKDVCLGATQSLALYQGVLYSGSHAHDCSQTPGGFPDGKRHHLLAQSADDKTIVAWFPNTNGGLGEALGPRSMVVAGNQMYVVGEFTVVNGVPQQGITRFATEPDTGYVDAPILTGSSKQVGKNLISWTAGWDEDDDAVTYELYRTGTQAPIYTTTVSSREWNRPRLSYMDTVTPGQTYSYSIRTSDGTNVSPKGAPVSVTAATTAEPYNGAVFEDGPVLNWKLDETSGSAAADDSGAGNAGVFSNVTLGGASALSSGIGRSAGFNGSNSRVSTANTTAKAGPNTYSVELWFRTSSTRGGKMIGFGNSRTGNSSNYDRHLYLTNSGQVVYGNYAGSVQTITSPGTYRNDAWHYVVGTTGSNGMRLYVDGVLVGTNATKTAQQFNGYWKVGGDQLNSWPGSHTSNFFSGSLDEVAVYEKALSPARVFEHYKQGRGTVTDNQAPTAPTGLAATANSSKVSLSWNASSDNMLVTGYEVHRSMQANFTPSQATLVALVDGSSTSTVDTASPGTWYYKVVAVDGNGNHSGSSNQVSVDVVDAQAPTTPGSLTATAFGDQVDLSWQLSTDDNSVSGYHVYRLTSAGGTPSAATLVGSVPTGSFTDTSVPPGTWYYKVVAFDEAGNASNPSDPASAKTTDASTAIDFDGIDAMAPAPAFTMTQQGSSTIASATLVGPSDSRFTYRGAGDFRFGTTYPDTLMYQPTSRDPHSWGSPSVWSVQFTTDAAQFEVYTKYYNVNQAIQVKVDGHRTTAVPRLVNGTSLGSRMVYKVDFGSAQTRNITLEVFLTPFGGIYLPPGATLTKSAALTTRWMVLGDSISGGSNANSGGGAGTWISRAADYLGWDDPWNQAIGGTGYVADNNGTSKRLIDRVDGDVTPYAPKRLVVWAGVNDQTLSQSSIATAAGQLYAKLKADDPGTRVYVAGPWSQSGNPTNGLQNTDETIRVAAKTAGLPFFSPITGKVFDATGTLVAQQRPWITGTGSVANPTGDGNADVYVGNDGVHPSDAGHAYIARRMALALEQLTKGEPAFDTVAPTGPASLTATVDQQTVHLSWPAASDNVGVTGYDVYRGTSAGFTPSSANKVANVTGTSADDLAVPAGTYVYKVVATDAAGNAGPAAASSSVTVLAADTAAPTTPSGVTTSVSGPDVTVSWQASSDNRGVTGYDVYRGSAADFTPGTSSKVATVTGTSSTDTGVLGGTWYYKVIAFDDAGNRSASSDAASAVVVPPASTSTTLSPTADTYVNAGNRTQNYGSTTSAIVDGSPVQQFLLRFDLPAAPSGQQLTSATLRLHTTGQSFASSVDDMEVRLASNTWDESTVTYETRPAVSSTVVGTQGPVDLNGTYEITLSASQLRALGAGETTLAVVMAGGDNAQFWSSNVGNSALRPELDLSFS